MKNFQIIRYIKKLLPLILVVCLLLTGVVYYKLSEANTYIASEVIHYNDAQAELGLAPTGEKLDVNEIRSSAVMSKVVEQMELTGIYSVDSLISRVDITPIEDEDKMAQKAAKLDEGEEYIYEPSTYIISFAANSDEGEAFARTMLDGILDVYFERFSQKYVNVAPAANTIENLNQENYDYIEMLEIIDLSIQNTVETLYQRMAQSNYYRATETGVSFTELVDDFNYLRQVEISSLISKIYKYQITRDKSVLVSDYTTRIDNNHISNAKDASVVEDIVAVMDAYVTKMRDSGNTDITFEYILDELNEKNLENYFGDQTVTYDELIYSWRNRNESREHTIIDSAYSRYIINTFTNCTGKCDDECKTSPLTCSELCIQEYAEIREDVEKRIDALLENLTSLYDITTKTNDEFNKYLGASYISVMASASVKESVNVVLYTAIAFVFLVVVCCGGAIVVGRADDILDYIFYTDHYTGFGNRAYLDKYLNAKGKKLLDNGVVYCMIDISNLIHINDVHTRAVGDDIIKMFADNIKENFGKSTAEYVYNGNGNFVVLTSDSDYITVEDIMRLFRLRLDEREEHRNVVIEYRIGIAETFRENKTARKLLSEAIENKKTYISDLNSKTNSSKS